jgi:N-acetylglucosamine-6-sulfatase
MRALRIPTLIVVLLLALAGPGPWTIAPAKRAVIATPGGALAASVTRPNIIFILTDDLDTKEIAFMPKLKSLIIDQGTSFSNFFVTYSLCCPSRSTILRGQYPHNHRVLSNTPPNGSFIRFHNLGNENSTIATWLRSAGYRTMLTGKYLNGYPTGVEPTYVPPGWDEWYSPAVGNAYGNYNYSLNENGKLVRYGNAPDDYFTDVLSRKAVDFIRRASREPRPFFMYLATYAPHAPATPAPRHQGLFLNETLPRSPSFNEADMSDKPAWIGRPPLGPRQIQQLEAHYRKRLQSLQAVDDLIVALVNELQAQGQLARTYIFFMSDNGFHLGEHRLPVGKDTAYEEDIRVPMIVRGPGVPEGRTLPHIGLNNDFAPTWAELAGASAPGFVDGRSLVPLLGANPPAVDGWRQSFLVERHNAERQAMGPVVPDPDRDEEEGPVVVSLTQAGAAQPQAGQARAGVAQAGQVQAGHVQTGAGLGAQQQVPSGQTPLGQAAPRRRPGALGGGIPEIQAVRARDYVYIEYGDGSRELYDLRSDLYQLQNLAATADPGLLRRLSAYLAALRTCAAAGCRSAEDAPAPALAAR